MERIIQKMAHGLKAVLVTLVMLVMSGCAGKGSIFQDPSLPEHLKPVPRGGLVVGSGEPSAPYQSLDWNLDE